MAAALNDVFGATVTYWTEAGQERTVKCVFREEPVEVVDDGVPVLITQPTLKVPLPLASELKRGVVVKASGPEHYRIVNRHQLQTSPADDRFVIFEMEQVEGGA